MGLFSRLLGTDRAAEPRAQPRPTGRLVMLGKAKWPEDLEIVGETYHQESFKAIFNAAGDDSGGVVNRIAVLRAEPGNAYDRNAVAIDIDGLLVGYVPAALAIKVQPLVLQAARRGEVLGVPARVWARNDGVSWGARVTLSTGAKEPEWTYAQQEFTRRAAREAAVRGVDVRAAEVRLRESDAVSNVRGKPYSDWTTTVENWKRAERYDDALNLLAECQAAAEAESRIWGRPPAPWYFEQAAIIHRKRKAFADEVAVLERYMNAARASDCSRDSETVEKIESRLFKAKKLAGGS